jgi:nucleotide-binding universal stress UspA family protein
MDPLVDRVFHPTDFSEASHVAFDHALAIAIARKATLTVLNASKGFRGDDWSRFPGVSDTLKRWGLLDESSDRRDIFDKLSVKVKKLGVDASDPADVILDFLGDHPNDLVVMATEAREGLPRLLKGSVAEKVTRASGARFLLVPTGCPGFVSKGDGSLSLKRVLVPVAETPDPNAAALAATRAAEALGNLPVELHAVHVGEDMPYVDLPLSDDWTWQQSIRKGDVIEEILATAREISADLIVMTTDGPDSFRDLFRGSHVHRVVRGAPCPVTAISIPKQS